MKTNSKTIVLVDDTGRAGMVLPPGSKPVVLNDSDLGHITRKALSVIHKSATHLQQGVVTAAGLALIAVAVEMDTGQLTINLRSQDGLMHWQLDLRRV